MSKEETVGFLKKVTPFNRLPEEELEGIVESISLEYFPKGVHILTQGGPPSAFLYAIKKGCVRVYMTNETEEEINLDYRSEGEHFGLLSLVSGDRSRNNVVAVEDTVSFLIPKEKLLTVLQRNPAVNENFLTSFLIDLLDKTQGETRKRYAGPAGGERVLYTTPVGEVVRKEPIAAAEDVSIQEAARIMVRHRISSLVITSRAGVPSGIVTDRDLREKVVARGLELHHPVRMIMTSPLIKIDAGEYCFEALLKMMRYNIHHILVVESGRFKGILTNHDFMVLQGASPMMLVKEIAEARDPGSLNEAASKIQKTVSTLLQEGAKGHNIAGIITELVEKILNRAIDLAEKRIGAAPLPYSLFLFGEGGRRELTLCRDLSMGIVHEQSGNAQISREAQDYFGTLKEVVGETMPDCHVSAGRGCLDDDCIMSVAEWRGMFDLWAADPVRYRPRAGFIDMRPIRGNRETVENLRRHLMKMLVAKNAMMDVIVQGTIGNRPPLGFFRRFVVEKSGEHRSELNLFEKGIRPLVEAVRAFAVQEGIGHYSTWSRVLALRSRYGSSHAEDIEHALENILKLLIHHQLEQIEAGEDPDNFINPDELDGLEKKTLKETFQLTTTLYDMMADHVSNAGVGI